MTRLVSVVIDAQDHIAQARWWARALEVPVGGEREQEAWLTPPDAPELNFVPVPEAKQSKNRTHFDLATYSAVEHAQLVERLRDIGARVIDMGQPEDADWVVLADPEGNEFCVVEPRPQAGYHGRIGEIGVDTAAVVETTSFWVLASGWQPVRRESTWAELRAPSGRGPYLFLVAEHEPKPTKNRIHLDVAPYADEDHRAEVDKLIEAGAAPTDIAQVDVAWEVLIDPGGNEFCVLTPRGRLSGVDDG